MGLGPLCWGATAGPSRVAQSSVRLVLVTCAAAASAGCATVDVSKMRTGPAIETLLAERGAQGLGWNRNGSAGSDTQFTVMRSAPMTANLAVRAAMLRSPQLQQVYGQLGLARADVLEAIQIGNPRLGLSRLALDGGPGSQFAIGIAQPLVDLLTLPAKARLAKLEYERARFNVAASILGVALDVEAAWYRSVSAQQVAMMRAAVAEALQTSAELARRFYDAGNITRLQLNREKAAAIQSGIESARASVASRLARLDLNSLIGITGKETEWALDATLPLPVAAEDDPAELQRMAVANSLDLLAARKDASVAAGAASITRAFRLLGTTAVGYDREREVDRSVIRGPTLDLELPIFNQGGSRVARAEARLKIARAKLAQIELSSANSIALGAERVRVLSQVVNDYRSVLVPARETVARESQLEQNYALIGEFEVLQARAQQFDAYQGLIEAVRDYWLARLDLTRLIGSRLPSDALPRQRAVTPAEYLSPKTGSGGAAGEDHHHSGAPAATAAPNSSSAGPPAPAEHHRGDGPASPVQPPAEPAATPPPPEHHHGGQS